MCTETQRNQQATTQQLNFLVTASLIFRVAVTGLSARVVKEKITSGS